jgi:heme/copper-type cytochrome/quinol oxidase subunit 2
VTALVAPLRAANPFRQDQPPTRRDITITAKNYAFTPDRIEVGKDDRVRLTIEGQDQIHSFALDEFRIARRIQPGTSAVVEFRADRVGSFTYYCNIGADPGCKAMRGTLVVVGK